MMRPMNCLRGRDWGRPDLRDLLVLRLEENRADQAVPPFPPREAPSICRRNRAGTGHTCVRSRRYQGSYSSAHLFAAQPFGRQGRAVVKGVFIKVDS
jgi:hypothetical protein